MTQTAHYANRPVSDRPRDVEAWALAEASRRLMQAMRAPDDREALIAALKLNQRLWTIFQAAMVEADCPLPAEVRENVLTLSILVDRETIRRLSDLDVDKMDRLIDINRSVSAGLSTKPQGDAAAQGMPAAASPYGQPQQPARNLLQNSPSTQGQPLRLSV